MIFPGVLFSLATSCITTNYAINTLHSVRYQYPVNTTDALGKKSRIPKGTEAYDNAVKKLPGHHIKESFDSFLTKTGIRKDVMIVERAKMGLGASTGNNFYRRGDAVVVLAPGLYETDKDACHFTIKHEMGHIHNNDPFYGRFLPTICGFTAQILITCILCIFCATPIFFAAWGLVGAVAILAIIAIVKVVVSRYQEGKADDFAITESSVDELKGGRRLFLALKAKSIAIAGKTQKSFREKIRYSSSGEYRLDFNHPSLKSRIEKIEQVLKKKNVVLDETEEQEKIKRLYEFIQNPEIDKT